MPVKDVQQLVQELQVHQVELEMQNEELRRTQAELGAARDRYADLYDHAPIGYLTLDSKGMILEANLSACRLLELNRTDLVRQPVIRFVAAKDQPKIRGHLKELFETGSRRVCEVDLAQRQGLSVQFESVAVQDEGGRQTCAFTALQDITARLQAEEQERQIGRERQQYLEHRVRIGHDLHDGVLQSLYAIGLGLESGTLDFREEPDKSAVALARSIAGLNSVIEEVRSFIREVAVENLSDIDLPASLRTMVGTLARLHGRQARVSISHAVTDDLSAAHNLEILHLVKEALSNSFRHTRATMVRVSLRPLKGGIRVVVQDNGKGLPQKRAMRDGVGFVSMEARAHRLGGTLSVQSKPANGTWVVLDLPGKSNVDDVNL